MFLKYNKSNKNLKSEPRRNFKQGFQTCMNHFGRNTDQFCKHTTLHGLKYVTDKDLYPRDRVFFGLAFITVVLFAGFFVLSVLDKWNTTPVIFGTNPQPSYITEEPFPAVTICNLNVGYKSKAEQFSIYSIEYAMLQLLCKRDVNVTIADSIKDWSNLIPFLTDIAQPCSNMILNCKFGGVKYNCTDLFKPIITDEGLCCTFNMVHPAFMYNSMKGTETNDTKDTAGHIPVPWTNEEGYPKELPTKFYPRKSSGIGESLGLIITLDVESHEYYCSSMNSVGFKVLVHSALEVPSVREIGLLLSPGRETKVRLRPEKYEADPKLRKISRKYRQCLFEDEEHLDIYTHYTQRNCEVGCLAKVFQHYCGCIPYYMPRIYGNESVCSIYQSSCVERLRIVAKLSEYNVSSCNEICLPSCYDNSFFLDFFSAPLKHFGFQVASEDIKNMSSTYLEENIAVAHMYFREYSYRALKQTEFFGGTDVLSSIGGLLGVFFGFSFISLVEFVYYAMIRPFRAPRPNGNNIKNINVGQNSNIENYNPPWKKPIRKRFKRELGFDGFKVPKNHLNVEKLYITGEFLKQKSINDDEFLNYWYNHQ